MSPACFSTRSGLCNRTCAACIDVVAGSIDPRAHRAVLRHHLGEKPQRVEVLENVTLLVRDQH